MLRALLAHPQEVLHKRHLVYCVRVMSVGCATIAVKLQHVGFITLTVGNVFSTRTVQDNHGVVHDNVCQTC
jgi:hypothetical protein